MNDATRRLLVEQTAAAHRERGADGTIRWHPAWFDLDEAGRRAAYEVAAQQRAIEAALDPRGLSGTAREVMGRIG